MTDVKIEESVEVQPLQTTSEWQTEPVAPWRRYGARSLDVIVNGGIGFSVAGFGAFLVAPDMAGKFFSLFDGPFGKVLDVFGTILMAGVLNAVVMGATGTTLGKTIFGIKVVNPDRSNLSMASCFRREFMVWVLGWGIGLPLVSLITLIVGYQTLVQQKQTTWDKGHHLVLYRPRGTKQSSLNALGIALIIAGRVLFAYLNTQ